MKYKLSFLYSQTIDKALHVPTSKAVVRGFWEFNLSLDDTSGTTSVLFVID